MRACDSVMTLLLLLSPADMPAHLLYMVDVRSQDETA